MYQIGWTMGRNKEGGQTGVYHLMVAHRKDDKPRFACGWNGAHDGTTEEPRRELKCESCRRWKMRRQDIVTINPV